MSYQQGVKLQASLINLRPPNHTKNASGISENITPVNVNEYGDEAAR